MGKIKKTLSLKQKYEIAQLKDKTNVEALEQQYDCGKTQIYEIFKLQNQFKMNLMPKLFNIKMQALGRREKYFALNSLSSIPIILLNKSVLIDMKNETSVAGRIISADGFMNITLNEVVFIDQKGLQYEFDEFMIPARNLRQIYIPDHINISDELNKFLNLSTKKTNFKKNPRANTFKVRRAERRHKETLKEIEKSQK